MEINKRWDLLLGNDNNIKTNSNETHLESTNEDNLLNSVLNDLYGTSNSGKQSLKNNAISISKWMGDLNELFDKDVVELIQDDAINKFGLTEILLSEDVNKNIQPSVELLSKVILLKSQIPEKSKENVRRYIKNVVDEVNKLISSDLRNVVRVKVNKFKHSSIPSAKFIDYNYTIKKNIKNYNLSAKKIIPENIFFYEKFAQTEASKWNLIIDLDSSASMSESVVYMSVLSSILASVNTVKTHVIAFNDEVVDLTNSASDPVEMLYGFNLGGGTEINKSLNYVETLISNNSKTILILVSDLAENNSKTDYIRKLIELKESGVTVICLLAVSDEGESIYNEKDAKVLRDYGVPVFTCSPSKLPQLIDFAINGKEIKKEEFN